MALGTFAELLVVFSTKVNQVYLLCSMDRRCCLLHLIKQNYLIKTFLRMLILMTLVSPHLFLDFRSTEGPIILPLSVSLSAGHILEIYNIKLRIIFTKRGISKN